MWLVAIAPARAAGATADIGHGIPRLAEPLRGATALTQAQQFELAAQPPAARRRSLDTVLAAHPDDALAHLIRAIAESELRDGAAALRDLEPVVLASTPRNRAFVFAARSEALLRMGRTDEGLADGERAIAADADDPQARLARGWALHMADKDDAEALRDIEASLAREPDNPVALARRGVLRQTLGDPERALADLRRASELAPRKPGIRVQLAETLAVQHQPEAARAQLDEAIRFAPDDESAWTTRARWEALDGNAAAAIADATRALELDGTARDKADAHLSRAIAWDLEKDYEKMLADLAEGEALNPRDASFASRRGIHEREQGQLTAAKATLTHALVLDPDCAICLSERALAEAQVGERESALADAQKAVEMAPGLAVCHLLYGNVLQKLQDFPAAIAQFDAAVTLDPADPAPRVNRGEAREAMGEHAAAIAEYTLILERFPSSFTGVVLVDRGYARYSAGDLPHAIADFRGAAAALPKDAESRLALGLALEKSGDFAGAADAYAQSLVLHEDDAAAYRLGRMLIYSGRLADAAEPLRTSLRNGKSTSLYVPLWIYLSRLRAQASDESAARTELARLAPPHDPRTWTDLLADYMLGRIDEAALKQHADDGPVDKRIGWRCEADYYAAEIELAHGRRSQALPLLAQAVRICPADFFEAIAAQAESLLQNAAPHAL